MGPVSFPQKVFDDTEPAAAWMAVALEDVGAARARELDGGIRSFGGPRP